MIEGLPKRIHCLGAAGAGMLPLALYLQQSGHEVSAEDVSLTQIAREQLTECGVLLAEFPFEEGLAVVYSSAVAESHEARRFQAEVGGLSLRRGECLALVAKTKRLLAIAGSHGKTTTCGMLIDILDTKGFSFDYLLGAQFAEGMPSRCSGHEWLVAEIDESDGTIDLFDPEISVILNIDHDHHARYASEVLYVEAFQKLAARTKKTVILDSRQAGRIGIEDGVKRVTLGEEGDWSVRGEEAGSSWTQVTIDHPDGEIQFTMNRKGRMNEIDASFAVAAAHEMGVGADRLQTLEFRSVLRRQRCWFNGDAVQVFEDYAHHPEELASVLAAFGSKDSWRTVVVFQAHRYSRTRELKGAFARTLSTCEDLVLLDVYPASETPIPGGTGQDLLDTCLLENSSTLFFAKQEEASEHLLTLTRSGNTRILILGAGTGDRLARQLALALAERDPRWGSLSLALAKVSGTETQLVANEPLAPKTTMRVGGKAERYFEPESLEQLKAVVKSCSEKGLPLFPLGRGSNVIVPDTGVSGLVIRLSHPYWSRFELLGEGRARLGAGLRIKALCGQAAKEGLEGFEFLEGIPGSLGGVLRMNAGAMGGWVFDVVESIRYLTLDGELIEATRDELNVGYRYCEQLRNAIAVDAVLVSKSENVSRAAIRQTIDVYQNKRKESQPREPSAGCIFKNPEGDAAGRLIQELGLKGTVVGGAEVSAVHGNFIINRGGASSADVIELVKLIRRIVKERRGIDLHPEALLYGAKWEEVLR